MRLKQFWFEILLVLASAASFGWGLFYGGRSLAGTAAVGCGAVGLSYVTLLLATKFVAATYAGMKRTGQKLARLRFPSLRVPALRSFLQQWRKTKRKSAAAEESWTPLPAKRKASPDGHDTHALVEEMLEQGRYALLMRPEIVSNLDTPQLQRAMEMLDEAMSIVPEGEVMLRPPLADDDDSNHDGTLVRVEGVYVDRYPVTNREYREFVLAGGYQKMALWDAEIWAGVLEFVDRSGDPGPAFWKHGTYLAGQDNHPVVGVSWYEAAAFARWVGKRLPTDAEWVKTGTWPVPVPGCPPAQRRFPWGDAMDRRRANLWGSGPGHIVPVTEFASGASVGGVYQLIGNVWQWTVGAYGIWHPARYRQEMTNPMCSIRGGAFDTYFDNQATCQFQSGENPLSRRHNIGFRCAVGVCDLVPLDLSDALNDQESMEALAAL